MSSLAHHGILGMKWGVRRFQRLDGSLTLAGLERKKKLVELGEKRVKQEVGAGDSTRGNVSSELSRHGIVADGSDTDILKKGSIINRYANQNEPLDSKRKYFSITPADKTEYGYSLSHLPIQGKAALFEYQVDRDLKIANGKKIESIIAAHFRDEASNAFIDKKQRDRAKRIVEAINEREENAKLTLGYYEADRDRLFNKDSEHSKYKKIDRKIGSAAEDKNRLYNDTLDEYSEAFSGKLHNKELVKALQKEGYDGYIDMFDAKTVSNPYSNYEYPLVILNPKDKMRLKRKTAIHSSIGGNMNYIYGNTLVLGDSSYLEHHGIKNQKWGVRRFQNPDGSLTAAGRIRYGVTGAAKAAFKVGKKLGAATASAAKAGVKKAKDNAYAKKKEKASQTREGVLKNKKMFTADELKALENRFKVEDEMSEARLRHGQAVAKTVSQYANTTRDVLSALQTGGNAVSAITKAFADIQSYKNAKGVAEAAKEKGMTTKEFDLFLKEKYPNATKDDRSKKKDKNSNKATHSDNDNDGDDDNPPNNGGGGGAGSKKQAQAKAEAETKAKADKEEAEERKALDKVNRIKASQPEPSATSEEGVKTVIKNSVAGTNKETRNSIRSAIQSIIKSSSGSKSGLDKLKKMAKDHAEDVKDSPDVDAVNDAYLKKLQSLLNNIKHSDMDELAHFGVKGMKWGKHLMAGKGSSTDISSGGGGGSPEEEDDETIADILGIDVDAYRQKINDGPFGYGQYADQLGEKAEKLHAQAEANRKMADQVGLTGNKKKAAEFRKKSEQLEKDAVKAEKLQTYMNRRANGESALGITADTVNTTIVKPIAGLANDIGRSVSASNPMNSDLVRKLRRVKHGSMDSFMIENGILRYGFDESDYLEHHGIKGQRWGVRRFQNADGSLTDKGRKHYQKKLALEERKLTAANAARGQYERVRTPMSVGIGILGAVAGAMVGVPAGPAGIAAGAAIVSSIAASSNYAAYTVAGIVAGQGAKRNMKKIAKYKEALAQDAFEIQNGVLIYGSGQSEELKHFGLKGMKWGVRRFQNPDGSLTDTGKKRYSNTGELDSGGKYKEEANTARVYREREKAKENRAIKNGNRYDAEAARSWQDLYSQSEKAMNSAYRKSIAGRYDALKAKRKKRYAKHSAFVKDGTLFLEYRGTNFPPR